MFALGYSRDSVYQRSYATLKRYNDSCYKVVLMKSCRLPGFEESGMIKTGKRNSAGNTAKLEASISRTKSRVTELALCNPWEYFVTLNPAYLCRLNQPGPESLHQRWHLRHR